jgi:hypothetical protein
VMRSAWYMAILPCRLNQEPSRVLGAGLGDSTLAALLA